MGRVLGQAPCSYIIIYRNEQSFVDYGRFSDNNEAVRESWDDKIYYGSLYEYDEGMEERMIKGFKKISLEEARLIEKANR